MEKRPFEGIKVVDLCFAGVGVFILNYLAHYGATTVRVESARRPDTIRSLPPFAPTYAEGENPGLERSGYYSLTHPAPEYGISLNLSHPKGKEVFKRLVAWADIVGENWPTGSMERLGLTYEVLKQVKPDIIMMRSCGYGHTGPMAHQIGGGGTISSSSMMYVLAGWPDRLPVPLSNYYTDQLSPLCGALALIAALDYRRRTGKGQCIDHSQIESGLNYLAPLLLDYAVNQRELALTGNKCAYAAPHGTYRCQGDDRWIAIGVFTDEEWDSFCRVIGKPAWTKEPKFSTLTSRVKNSEELDKLVEEWTINFTAEQVMAKMQAAGVGAGVVSNAKDLDKDIQLKHYDFNRELDHPYIGRVNYYHPPAFKLAEAPAEVARPNLLGEHTEYVCKEVLGMSDEELVQLIQEGVLE